jgi:hypothetical protein
MSVQSSIDNRNIPFILTGIGITRGDATILQDAGRGSVALVFGTLMAKIAATQKWVPFTDETATTGAANPQGVYVGAEITGAALVAGDVLDVPILVGDAVVDVNQLVIENSKTLDTIIGVTSVNARTVRDQLAFRGIFAEDTVAISDFEN